MEKEFTACLLKNLTEAEKLGAKAPRLKQSVEKLGGVSVCKGLIKKEAVSDNFDALLNKNRPDLTVEAVVIKSEFAALFTDDEVNFCFALLCEAGYFG